MKPPLCCLLEEVSGAQTLLSLGQLTQTSPAWSKHSAPRSDHLQIPVSDPVSLLTSMPMCPASPCLSLFPRPAGPEPVLPELEASLSAPQLSE